MRKLYASFTATSAMTLFSYLFSLVSGSNLREPHILARLINRLVPWKAKMQGIVGGWVIHYAVGLLFSELYLKFWEHTLIRDEKKAGLVYGGMAGLAAILIWKFTLSVHPFPPAIDFALFSLNLFLGHVIFGLITAIC